VAFPEAGKKEAFKELCALGAGFDGAVLLIPPEHREKAKAICGKYKIVSAEKHIPENFELYKAQRVLFWLHLEMKTVERKIAGICKAEKIDYKDIDSLFDIRDTLNDRMQTLLDKYQTTQDNITYESNRLAIAEVNKTNPSNEKLTPETEARDLQIGTLLKQNNYIQVLSEKFSNYSAKKEFSLSGIPTGYKALDNLLDGLEGSRLITIAGRTGMGKTWVILNLIINIAIKQHRKVLLVSLEMSLKQLTHRLISLLTGISVKKIRRGELDEKEWDAIVIAHATIAESSIFITDDPRNADVFFLLDNIKRIHKEFNQEVIFIDHIGLITSKTHTTNRVNAVSEITRSLKLAANDLNIPIILASQLNREADNAERPELRHLRESGSVEQDSDIIIFVYRADYGDKEKPRALELIVKKNRDGEEGTINFYFKNTSSWLLVEKQEPKTPSTHKDTVDSCSAYKEEEAIMTSEEALYLQ